MKRLSDILCCEEQASNIVIENLVMVQTKVREINKIAHFTSYKLMCI